MLKTQGLIAPRVTVRQFASDRQRPDGCGGKTRLGGSTVEPTGINGVAPPISLQVLLQQR